MKTQKQHHVHRLRRRTPFALRPHHAKPYRARHLVALSIASLTLLASLTIGLQTMLSQYNAELNASLSGYGQVSALTEKGGLATVRSSLGFGLRYDSAAFSVSATALSAGGDVLTYDAGQLGTVRAYSTVTVKPRLGQTGYDLAGSNVIIHGESATNSAQAQTRLQAAFREATAEAGSAYSVRQTTLKPQQIAGANFEHRNYVFTPKQRKQGVFSMASSYKDVFVGILPNNTVVSVEVRAIGNTQAVALYQAVLAGLFSSGDAAARTSNGRLSMTAPTPPRLNWLEKFGVGGQASALLRQQQTTSQTVSQIIPAVVKLYHVACGQITYRNQPLVDNGCTAASGTGFFVSSDGYIATNGHVVSAVAKTAIAENLDAPIVAKLLQIDGYSEREIAAMTKQFLNDPAARLGLIAAVNDLSQDDLTYANKKDYYIVALANDIPNLEQILTTKAFKETTTLKLAELKAVDYNPADMDSEDGFSHSDVAVLKLPGSNYPVVRLGNVDSLVQGAPITLVGYPSDAEDNNLVSSDTLETTVTQGIVGAIRRVQGNGGRVVQSDATIGRGNSGGPGFDQNGEVFGIVTYLLNGQGGAGLSYLRDIQDFKNVLAAHDIHLQAASSTQTLWEEGLQDFYAAHYTAARTKFQAVERQYPSHVLAAQYIGLSETKIKNGEEAVSSARLGMLWGGVLVALLTVVYVVILIVRHRAHHHVYQAVQAGYLRGPFAEFLQVPIHALESIHANDRRR